MRTPSVAIGWWLSVAALALIGCGDDGRLPTAPVSGVVTLDGRPVIEGEVLFLPATGRPARGKLDADGRFTLRTYASSDGAVVGTHRVGVVAFRGEATPESETQTIEWLVPEHYANPETSGLSFEVQPGQTNPANFTLTSVTETKNKK